MDGNYNNNDNLKNFQSNNMQNNNQPNLFNENRLNQGINQTNNVNQNLFGQNVNQSNSVNQNVYQQNMKSQSYDIEQFQESAKNNFKISNSLFKKNNKKSFFIILCVLVISIIIIKCLILNKNDNDSTKVNNNQKLVECETDVIINNEKTKRISTSYVIENLKIVKYISSQTFYLNVSSNKITDEDVKIYEKEGSEECNSYPNNECELVVDYQKGEKFKYDIIFSGSLLDKLNDDMRGLSYDEIIKKIKEKEEKNLLSCEVK